MNIEKVQVGLMGAFIAGVGITGVLIGSKFLAISAIAVATLGFVNEAIGNINIVALVKKQTASIKEHLQSVQGGLKDQAEGADALNAHYARLLELFNTLVNSHHPRQATDQSRS